MDYLLSYDTTINQLVCFIIQYNNTLIQTKSNIDKIYKILQINNNYNLLHNYIIVGPKLNYKTPWCSNVLEIFKKSNINYISRIEKFILYKSSNNILFDINTMQIYSNLPNTLNSTLKSDPTYSIPINTICEVNENMNLAMDQNDLTFYTNLYKYKLKRDPTNVELFDLAQSNSEHSRHWIFNGKLIIDNIEKPDSLFKLVKQPYLKNPNNSILAFCDNSSAIKGFTIDLLLDKFNKTSTNNQELTKVKEEYNIAFTAETHNFPTAIAPFQGANTGIGGRIRDNLAIGKGGTIIASTAGYCVGEIINNKDTPALEILIEASNGASDYGNKIGEPVIQGFTRSFKQNINNLDYEWIKPIMFTGGIGQVSTKNLLKDPPNKNMLIIQIGGLAYKIGLGGGSASSKENSNVDNYSAVQRGDPEMANRLYRVVRFLSENNIIKSIHDQGAGGMANVTKEIISPLGGKVYLNNVNLGDKTMSDLEIWGAEYQEQVTILINKEDLEIIEYICKKENTPYANIGYITNTNRIEVFSNNSNNSNTIKKVVDLNLNDILVNIPQKTYYFNSVKKNLHKLIIPEKNLFEHITQIFSLISVSSKRFLTNKVDRSVTGLVAQQQCVGPLHTPLSNYSIIAQSYFNKTGAVFSIGEQPIKSFICPKKMARLTVGEMLTNIIFAKITNLKDIKCEGNWMWSPKLEGEGSDLYYAVETLKDTLIELEIAIDGGKDSMSMHSNINNKLVKTPQTLVLSGYAPTIDITKKITPDLKKDNTNLLFIDLGYNNHRMGGSAFAQAYNQIGNNVPDFENIENFKVIFSIIQNFINDKIILSGHDKSDGGLITTILEMCFSGNKGCNLNIINSNIDYTCYLFNEELGLVIEVDDENINTVLHAFENIVPITILGKTTNTNNITINYNSSLILNKSMTVLRQLWEYPSYCIEKKQVAENYADYEYNLYGTFFNINYYIPNSIQLKLNQLDNITNVNANQFYKYKVAIYREEGSNGDKEMASAFYSAGFKVYDITSNDLNNNPNLLCDFNGLVYVGGFSFSDVLGSASGWYNVIINSPNIYNQIIQFNNRDDTFSLGVCNGCQLMILLNIIPNIKQIKQNNSKKFESRYSTVTICKNNSIMLHNLENLTMGIWIAHGEGNINITNNSVMKYVDHNNKPTTTYPFNPNGSCTGTAGLCSCNGRHLAIMPHPERCYLNWQLPWMPVNYNNTNLYSPWFLMFKNAYDWCNSLN